MAKIGGITIWAEKINSLVRNWHGLLLIRYASEIIYSIVKI